MDSSNISKLVEILVQLRDPTSGCPWDLRQTFATIAPYTIEESYEVADAIERGDWDELAGELGDLLFQVVFHARMAEEAGLFDFEDVAGKICQKMIARHPHVFAGESIEDPNAHWEQLKRQERAERGNEGVLGGIALALPGLTRAAKLGQRASAVGFDWPTVDGVRAKISEELAELDAAVAQNDAEATEAEVGDVLFAVTNLCRHLKIDPENALRGANRRFERRFSFVEQAVADSGKPWHSQDLDRLNDYWLAAKAAEQAAGHKGG